jgi:non-heme chloroperoxidase
VRDELLLPSALEGEMHSRDVALSRKAVITSDGIELSVIDVGVGPPIVILPAWTNSALEYRSQIDDLARDHRVVAVDMRSHGRSEKTGNGQRVSRYAADLRDILDCLGLSSATLIGHSMGCSVIWCYFDLFGSERIASLVLVDQAATQVIQPHWSAEERLDYGCSQTPDELFAFCARLAGPDGETFTREMFTSLFTSSFPREEIEWIVEEILAMPRAHAAALMLDHAQRDWRDVFSRIDKPALVVGAQKSVFPVTSQQWIARQIPRSQLAIFDESEGGSHFMCIENPTRFNALVRAFLASRGHGS